MLSTGFEPNVPTCRTSERNTLIEGTWTLAACFSSNFLFHLGHPLGCGLPLAAVREPFGCLPDTRFFGGMPKKSKRRQAKSVGGES